MKHLLLTTIAAVVLVGCGESQPTEPPTAEAPRIPIVDAAMDGDIEAVKQHLADGVNVNAKRGDGATPLHLAAYGVHKEIAELLIAKGADVNTKIEVGVLKGETPLDWATDRDTIPTTADLLRKHGGKTGEELKAEGK